MTPAALFVLAAHRVTLANAAANGDAEKVLEAVAGILPVLENIVRAEIKDQHARFEESAEAERAGLERCPDCGATAGEGCAW